MKKLKLSAFFSASLLTLAVLAGTSGCTTAGNTASRATGMPTYALAVAVRGGVEPTPAQWHAMYAKFSQALLARGMLLINDYRRADHIINVEFLPDPINTNIGTALVSSIVPNNGAYGRIASLGSTITPAGYSSYSSRAYDPMWATHSAYDSYGGYHGYNSYNGYDNSGSSSIYTRPPVTQTGTTPPVTPVTPGTPPHLTRPTNPADCPPGTTPYLPPPSYVGNHPRHPGQNNGDFTPRPPYTPPPRSYSDSNPSYSSSSGSSSGRSSYSPPSDSSSSYSSSASSSSASSYSAPSYSAPSYSPPPEPSHSSSSESSGRDFGSRTVPN